MAEASQKYVCVKAPKSIWSKFQVRSTPTMIVINPDEEVVERVRPRDAAGLSARLKDLAGSVRVSKVKSLERLPVPKKSSMSRDSVAIEWAPDLDEARKAAAEGPKAIVLLVTVDPPDTDPISEHFLQRKVRKVVESFVFCRIQYDSENKLFEDLGLKAIPAVLVLDPEAEMAASVLAAHEGDLATDDIEGVLKPYTEPTFRCGKCGGKAFTGRSCCGAAMDPAR